MYLENGCALEQASNGAKLCNILALSDNLSVHILTKRSSGKVTQKDIILNLCFKDLNIFP